MAIALGTEADGAAAAAACLEEGRVGCGRKYRLLQDVCPQIQENLPYTDSLAGTSPSKTLCLCVAQLKQLFTWIHSTEERSVSLASFIIISYSSQSAVFFITTAVEWRLETDA